MNLIAVAAPQQHTGVDSTSSNGEALITVANYLDGAAILAVLAVAVIAVSSAGMLPKVRTRPKPIRVRTGRLAR